MGCRCNERAEAIRTGANALAKGEIQPVIASAKFVAVTAAQDISNSLRERTAAAKARLISRR
jgi:hypothetical protein